MESLIILAMAVSTISLTVSKSKIFESTRNWVSGRSKWLGELISCFYCFSHWVAAVLVLLTGLTTQFGFIITVLAVINVAAVFSSVIIGLSGGAGHPHNDDE